MPNQKMLQAIFEETTLGILVVNASGEIQSVNPFLEDLFGYKKEELLGRKIEILLPESFRKNHIQDRSNYCKTPVPRPIGANLELYGQKKDGSQFYVEISLSYFESDDKRMTIVFISDVTDKKNTERSLQENHRKYMENEVKLKVALEREKELNVLKSRFVSMASHEFRTPLTSILSSTNLIGRYDQTEQQDKRLKHVNRIRSSVKNLTNILNDFLSLEILESGKLNYHPSSIDIKEYIESIMNEINLISKNKKQVHFQHIGKKEVLIDEHLVKNILLNLLSNAIKYSPEDKDVRLISKIENSMLEIQVKDQGIGIPKADQKHMFTRFFRATNVHNIKGTGLGLTIVNRYLDLMGGSINFESREGKGSTFTVRIPQNFQD